MRIERLHLLKYRALEDVALPFAPGRRVHLVYGPQEAGKTTALAAIADALFGFPHAKLPNAVRFPVGDLRVEMHLASAGGERLAFRRRKARDRTLLDPDEMGHLPDHALGPYIGALDRDGFERTFGLTSQRLRAAGAGMQASGGDTGAALFAASSGLADLGRLTGALDGEADALFGQRRKAARRFYQIEREHDDAKARETEAQLTGSRWQDLRRRLAELEDREAKLNEERGMGLRAIARLELLGRLAPIHGRIGRLGESLAAFEDLAGVPHDEVARLVGLTQDKHEAIVAEAQAVETLERERARLAAVTVDALCLDHAETVEALMRRAGAVEKALSDLPRVSRERNDHERELATLAGRLGLAPASLAEGAPTEPALARLAELVREGRQGENDRRALAEALEGERDVAMPAAPLDPAPLRRRLDALAPDLQTLATLAERRDALAAAERAVRDEARRLSPSVDMEDASGWSLPDEATLAARAAAIAAAQGDVAANEKERAALASRRAALAAEVERGASGSLVTRDAIEAARAERDAALGEGVAPAALRVLVARADELADRAFADAEGVARHEQRLAELATVDAARERLDMDGAAASTALSEARAAFDALLPFVTAEVASERPDHMLRWVSRVADLRERWGGVEEQRRGVAALEVLDGTLRPPLAALAGELDCAADLPAAALGRLVGDALGGAEEAWQEHRRHHALAEERARRVADLEQRGARAEGRRAEWQAAFAAALAACGLPSTFGLAAAEAAGGLWAKVPALLDMRDGAAARVRGMERDRDTFEQDVAAAVAALDPEMAELPAAAAVERLSARCREASHSAAAKREIERAVAEADEGAERASLAADAAQARLAQAAAALTGEETDLAPVIARLNERKALLDELARERHTFREAAGGADLEPDALDDFDPVAAELELETLRTEADALQSEGLDVHAQLVALRREQADLERAGGAEEHAFARNAAAAGMAAVGRQWLVLRAARHLLDLAVARQRERDFGPMIARAGALFAALTGGSFERLEQDYADDEPRLVGVRPNGERVATDGMSEGTHDQLFLALRLAHLEAHAQSNEPMPFVADDIFMTFDRERTRHGLRALGEVAGAFQPILFTHHDFVVDEAQAVLGDTLDLIDLSAARVAVPA